MEQPVEADNIDRQQGIRDCESLFLQIGGRDAIPFFERTGEMAVIDEPGEKGCIAGRQMLFIYQVIRFLKSSVLQPLIGCGPKNFIKIALKGGNTTACQPCKIGETDVVPEMFLHEPFQVDFSSFGKVKEDTSKSGIDVQQDRGGFPDLDPADVVEAGAFVIQVRGKGSEIAFQYSVGLQVHDATRYLSFIKGGIYLVAIFLERLTFQHYGQDFVSFSW